MTSTVTGGEEDVLALRPEQWRELLVSGYERSEALVEAEEAGISLLDLDEEWTKKPPICETAFTAGGLKWQQTNAPNHYTASFTDPNSKYSDDSATRSCTRTRSRDYEYSDRGLGY
jgi:hypothetical protein